MENPLTEEQIKEMNELSKLPLEEQKEKLPGFLKKLSPEQINFLKSQQGQGCVFCSIAEGKIPAKKIYEDREVIAVLDINPANKGHIVLFPKKHYEILSLVKDVGHLFNVANKISSAVFEVVNAEGTNIFVANGLAAGQNAPHIAVHIIPRFKDDKVSFAWEKKEVDEKDMDRIGKALSEKLSFLGKEKKKKVKIEKITRPLDDRIP